MADRRVPRAEDRLASHRYLIAAAVAPLLLAACGSEPTTQVGLRNDLRRPVQIGLCATTSCRHVRWWIGIDPAAVAFEPVPSDGRTTRRFIVVGPPDTVYGCLAFTYPRAQPDVLVPLSSARGCGSGR